MLSKEKRKVKLGFFKEYDKQIEEAFLEIEKEGEAPGMLLTCAKQQV